MGRNGQGKTNLLEAAYYPVLLPVISRRGRFGAGRVRRHGIPRRGGVRRRGGGIAHRDVPGLGPEEADRGRRRGGAAPHGGDRPVARGGVPSRRRGAGGRVRRSNDAAILDRMLSLAEPAYLRALLRYRGCAGPAERGAAAAAGRRGPGVRADPGRPRARCSWSGGSRGSPAPAESFAEGARRAGRSGPRDAGLHRATPSWPSRRHGPRPSRASFAADRARGMTTDRPAPRRRGACDRRAAAPGLRLDRPAPERRRSRSSCSNWPRCGSARGIEPALLLDDVFAELDAERQRAAGRRG